MSEAGWTLRVPSVKLPHKHRQQFWAGSRPDCWLWFLRTKSQKTASIFHATAPQRAKLTAFFTAHNEQLSHLQTVLFPSLRLRFVSEKIGMRKTEVHPQGTWAPLGFRRVTGCPSLGTKRDTTERFFCLGKNLREILGRWALWMVREGC